MTSSPIAPTMSYICQFLCIFLLSLGCHPQSRQEWLSDPGASTSPGYIICQDMPLKSGTSLLYLLSGAVAQLPFRGDKAIHLSPSRNHERWGNMLCTLFHARVSIFVPFAFHLRWTQPSSANFHITLQMPALLRRVSSLWLLWPVLQCTPFLRHFSHSTLHSCSLCIHLFLLPHPQEKVGKGISLPACSLQDPTLLWACKKLLDVCSDGSIWTMGYFILHLCNSQKKPNEIF